MHVGVVKGLMKRCNDVFGFNVQRAHVQRATIFIFFWLIPKFPRYTDVKKTEKAWNGYSILECLMVLSIIIILATIAVPNFRRLGQEWTLWGTARSIESSLQWGRMHAISSNTPILFNVFDSGSRYCWVDAASGEKYANTAHMLPHNIQIESAPGRPLRFYQYGNAVPAGTYVIRGEAGSYSVVVSPGGRIRIQRN